MSSPTMTTTMRLMQNSHTDGSAGALRVLLLFILCWEGTYRIVKYVMCQLLLGKRRTNFTPNNMNSSYDTTTTPLQTQTLLACGPSYIVSTIHAIIVTARGCIHLYQLWDASPYDKFVIPPDFTTTTTTTTTLIQDATTIVNNYRGAHLLVARTNTIFVSYLLYDVCHVLHQYPKLGKADTVLHHILFILCSFINGTYGIMAFAFGWLIVGEASTVLLNIRWFLVVIQLSSSGQQQQKTTSSSTSGEKSESSDDDTKCEGGGDSSIQSSSSSSRCRTTTTLLDTINILFAITFLIVRVIVYTIGVIHLFIIHHGTLIIMMLPPQTTTTTTQHDVPRILLTCTCGCIVLGWGLNLIWGMKIIAMVVRRKKAMAKKKNS